MDATKNRGRSKIFTCFKPVVDGDHEPASGDSALLPYSADDRGARRKKRLRRSFSAALKAVLFRTSLLKKCQSENSKQDRYGSKSNFLSKSKIHVNSVKKNLSCKPSSEPDEVFRSNSDRSSLFSLNSSSRTPSLVSSSSASSCSSHSWSGSDMIKRSDSLDFRQMSQVNKQKTMKRDCGRKRTYKLTLEICVFFICLVALNWGKVFAIVICTSTLLLFAPDGRRSRLQLRKLDSFDIVDSEGCKKRVIMEGLPERNR